MKNAIGALGRLEWQAIALVLLLFGSGAAVGVAVERARAPRFGAPRRGGGPLAARPGAGRLPPYLEELSLTEDQHERIRGILDAQRPKVDSVMMTVLPRLRALSDTTFSQIRSVLTPDQQSQFDRDRPQRELAPGMPGGRQGGGRGFGGPGRGGRGPNGPPPGGGPPD
jgi:Spy/CpxP family protein refolding chaperone